MKTIINNNNNNKQVKNSKLEKIKSKIFSPVSQKTKTTGIICSLGCIFVFSVIMAILQHWLFAFIPLILLSFCFYCAKLPVKQEKPQDKAFRGSYNGKKNKK